MATPRRPNPRRDRSVDRPGRMYAHMRCRLSRPYVALPPRAIDPYPLRTKERSPPLLEQQYEPMELAQVCMRLLKLASTESLVVFSLISSLFARYAFFLRGQ